jgi:hypothetical protein
MRPRSLSAAVAQLVLVRSMRRWLIAIVAILVVGGYVVTYRFLPWRNASRFRHAELFVHTRHFRYVWEVWLFYPAAYVEWRLIRAHPQPWLPHPSWASYPQVFLLEAGDYRIIFPRGAFRKGPNQSMKPTAPPRNKFSVFVTTPCRGLSLSR